MTFVTFFPAFRRCGLEQRQRVVLLGCCCAVVVFLSDDSAPFFLQSPVTLSISGARIGHTTRHNFGVGGAHYFESPSQKSVVHAPGSSWNQFVRPPIFDSLLDNRVSFCSCLSKKTGAPTLHHVAAYRKSESRALCARFVRDTFFI